MGNPLRTKFEQFLTFKRYADKTKEAYVGAVAGLAQFHHKSPDLLENDQIQQYLQHLLEDRRLAWSTCNVIFSGLQCFYEGFLHWPACRFTIPPRPRSRKLPMLLSRAEVQRLFEVTANLKHRTLLMAVYGAGFRVSEVVRLAPRHIESAPERMLIRVEQGKGRKDRYTLLPQTLLDTLREYWREFRPTTWLFPGEDASLPMPVSTAQRIYYHAKKKPA